VKKKRFFCGTDRGGTEVKWKSEFRWAGLIRQVGISEQTLHRSKQRTVD
jgi:hypothetical protein